MKTIVAETSIQQMLKDHPHTAQILTKYNLGCVGCQGIAHETVARGATAHGLDVKELLRDLNAAILPKG